MIHQMHVELQIIKQLQIAEALTVSGGHKYEIPNSWELASNFVK